MSTHQEKPAKRTKTVHEKPNNEEKLDLVKFMEFEGFVLHKLKKVEHWEKRFASLETLAKEVEQLKLAMLASNHALIECKRQLEFERLNAKMTLENQDRELKALKEMTQNLFNANGKLRSRLENLEGSVRNLKKAKK